MKNIKQSKSNEEFAPQQNAAVRKKGLPRLTDLISEYPSWLIQDIKDFLSSGKLKYIKNSVVGCYDAEIIENGELLFVEVNLDVGDQFLEDCHCTCNTGLCTHLAAIIWKINEDKKQKGVQGSEGLCD